MATLARAMVTIGVEVGGGVVGVSDGAPQQPEKEPWRNHECDRVVHDREWSQPCKLRCNRPRSDERVLEHLQSP